MPAKRSLWHVPTDEVPQSEDTDISALVSNMHPTKEQDSDTDTADQQYNELFTTVPPTHEQDHDSDPTGQTCY